MLIAYCLTQIRLDHSFWASLQSSMNSQTSAVYEKNTHIVVLKSQLENISALKNNSRNLVVGFWELYKKIHPIKLNLLTYNVIEKAGNSTLHSSVVANG